MKKQLSLVFLAAFVLSGCAINRLAPPEEKFLLTTSAESAGELNFTIEDARSHPLKESRAIENGFVVGDAQLLPSLKTFLERQLAVEIASHEFKHLILEKLKGLPVKLVSSDIKVVKDSAQSLENSRYDHLPAGQAAFGFMMDSFAAELARFKRVTVRFELEIGKRRYSAENWGSYNVVPTTSALSQPAQHSVKEIVRTFAEEAAGLAKAQ